MRDTAALRRVVLGNEEWREPGGRRRGEVARHARRGRPHPDPYVAAVARGWAALLGLVAAALPDPASVLMPGGTDGRERGLARRILAAVGE